MTSDCNSFEVTQIAQSEQSVARYNKIANENCLKTGGVKDKNFCISQVYLYTINQKVLGYDTCVQVYQCLGFSWTCLRSNGGYVNE